MFIAELETRSFSFRAVGRTEAEALMMMKRAWKAHRSQTSGAEPFSEFEDGVHIWEAVPRNATRDGWTIIVNGVEK